MEDSFVCQDGGGGGGGGGWDPVCGKGGFPAGNDSSSAMTRSLTSSPGGNFFLCSLQVRNGPLGRARSRRGSVGKNVAADVCSREPDLVIYFHGVVKTLQECG